MQKHLLNYPTYNYYIFIYHNQCLLSYCTIWFILTNFTLPQLFRNPAISKFFPFPLELRNSGVQQYFHPIEWNFRRVWRVWKQSYIFTRQLQMAREGFLLDRSSGARSSHFVVKFSLIRCIDATMGLRTELRFTQGRDVFNGRRKFCLSAESGIINKVNQQ